jgi:hypothetical protein
MIGPPTLGFMELSCEIDGRVSSTRPSLQGNWRKERLLNRWTEVRLLYLGDSIHFLLFLIKHHRSDECDVSTQSEEMSWSYLETRIHIHHRVRYDGAVNSIHSSRP